MLAKAIVGGAVIGMAYALSPLTLLSAVAMALLVRWAVHDITGVERRWVVALLVAAIAARVASIAILFLTTNHAQVPFGSLFGDEEYFIKRSMWLRNVALGIPIHRADLIYAFDDYSYTSYLYVLAFLHVIAGPSPYGVHLFAAAAYLAAAVMLFRRVRPALGPLAAFGGLTLMLLLPSLFAWSISALKEPLYLALVVAALSATIGAIRSPRWSVRIALVIFVVGAAVVLQTMREGGAAVTIAGIAGGLVLAWSSARPRVLWTSVVLAPLVVALAWRVPEVQIQAWRAVRQAARVHWGHISTVGYTYKVLDERLYRDRSSIDTMDAGEVMRYVVRSSVAYVAVPLPWNVESRAALLYVPEQMLWFLMLVLAPVGIVAGCRRDRLTTCLLVSFALAAAVPVALTSGNVGTLVRHRGLAIPFLVWLSSAGVVHLAARVRRVGPVPRLAPSAFTPEPLCR